VDNASTDGTVEYLRNLVEEHSNYKLIENKENKGFAAGNNQGVAVASGEYVCLLNNDVLVSDGWLESLVESLGKDEKIGMVGPITNSISGRQMVNSIPYTDDAGFHEFSQKIRKACYGRLTPRYRIAGFAVLLKKSLYEDVGGLDESFGTGNYEDDDLCLKIREKGYAIMVDESVFIHHYRSQTFIENKIDYRNSLSVNESKFMKKWPGVDYTSLLELDKGLVDINADLVSQGQKAIESENADEAIKVYSQALSTNPIDEAALCGIGMAYQMGGKTDSATDVYKKVIKIHTYSSRQPPSGGNSFLLDAYHNLALVYAGANQIDDAIFMLKKAIALNGRDASLHNNLGVLYFKKKMHTEAAQCFSDALSIDAHYGEAKKNLERVSSLKNS
jgi:tetratricopeptide (TPR) repeat protein